MCAVDRRVRARSDVTRLIPAEQRKRQDPDHLPRPRGAPRDRRRARARRHHHPLPDPGDDALRRPARHRPHRPGPHRHRQDAGVRHPAAAAHRRPARPRPRRPRRPDKPQALVVAPTRELALQVSNDLDLAGKDRGTRILTVYGGVPYDAQLDALAGRRRGRRRHARAGCSTWPTAARSTSPTSRCSSSTRPTRCSTWASSPTSSGCSPRRRRPARRCCSRRPCRARSSRWPAPTCGTR